MTSEGHGSQPSMGVVTAAVAGLVAVGGLQLLLTSGEPARAVVFVLTSLPLAVIGVALARRAPLNHVSSDRAQRTRTVFARAVLALSGPFAVFNVVRLEERTAFAIVGALLAPAIMAVLAGLTLSSSRGRPG